MDTIRVPMLFPGQASQAVGMARDLADQGGLAATWLASIDATAGTNLTTLMFDGPLETLTETRNAQPAILAHSVAVALELKELGIEPSAVAGHSLGELSAAAATGALDADHGPGAGADPRRAHVRRRARSAPAPWRPSWGSAPTRCARSAARCLGSMVRWCWPTTIRRPRWSSPARWARSVSPANG